MNTMRTFNFDKKIDSCYLFKLNYNWLDGFNWNCNENQDAVGIYYNGEYEISESVFNDKIQFIINKLNSILLNDN